MCGFLAFLGFTERFESWLCRWVASRLLHYISSRVENYTLSYNVFQRADLHNKTHLENAQESRKWM